jgi:hypothetical protein
MELENIILSEVSQAQKAKSHMFSLICTIDLKRSNVVKHMSHKGEAVKGRDRAREGNENLELG